MKKDKLKQVFNSKVVIFVLLLIFIWLGIVSVRTIYKKYQLDKEISSVKNEIEKLDKKNQELSQMLDYFSSQNFLEKEAKEKLNLKKEGETVVMVNENSLAGEAAILSVATTTAQETGGQENNFIKWWKYFFAR